jgi:apolipoprotein N-acyltransferase
LIAIDELPKFSRAQVNSISSKSWVRRFLGNIRTIPKRSYGIIYLCALVHWLMVLHFLRLPFWATGIAGFFLCAYCAAYIPLWIGLSRVAVHRWRLPLPLVVVLVWMGFEYMRQWFLSGFAMACLAHTQYRFLSLIQIAEFGGATLVSGLILLPVAWLAGFLWLRNRAMTAHLLTGTTIVAIFVVTLWFGQQSMQRTLTEKLPTLIVQGSIDSSFDENRATQKEILQHYHKLTIEGLTMVSKKMLSLDGLTCLWPESMFAYPHITFDKGIDSHGMGMIPAVGNNAQLVSYFDLLRNNMRSVADVSKIDFLVGLERIHLLDYERSDRFNSAVAYNIDEGIDIHTGALSKNTYDKQHLVPFGEFVPLGNLIPAINKISPIGGGLGVGARPMSRTARDGTSYSVTICYESVMPQVIRRQMLELRERGETPDVLINLTNDGWFWGSSELDLHLVCGVFRAIEARRPLLIAANTGMSAAIDPLGRITARGKRHEPDTLFVHAQVLSNQDDDFLTFYHRYGELPGMIGLAFSAIVATYSIFNRNKKPT